MEGRANYCRFFLGKEVPFLNARHTHWMTFIGCVLPASAAIWYGLYVRHNLWIACLALHLGCCAGIPLWYALASGNGRRIWRSGWGEDGRYVAEGILVGLASGVCLCAAVMAGSWLLFRSGIHPASVRAALAGWGLTRGGVWLLAAYLVLVNALMEEWLWRGFLLERLLALGAGGFAPAASAVGFALYHILIAVPLFGWKPGLLISGLVCFVGLFWASLKRAFGTLHAPWLSHLLADFGIAVALYAWVYG